MVHTELQPLSNSEATDGVSDQSAVVAYEKGTVSGPAHCDTLTTGAGPFTAREDPAAMRPPSEPHGLSGPPPGTDVRTARAWKTCKAALECAFENASDPVSKANALYEYQEALARLWKEREHREKGFAVLVNRLQVMLIGADLTTVRPQHVEALLKVVNEAPRHQPLSSSNIRKFSADLDKAGCDVFKGLRSDDWRAAS